MEKLTLDLKLLLDLKLSLDFSRVSLDLTFIKYGVEKMEDILRDVMSHGF
jgi:hypothetical protein